MRSCLWHALQALWKEWLQGSTRRVQPSSNGHRHTAHSAPSSVLADEEKRLPMLETTHIPERIETSGEEAPEFVAVSGGVALPSVVSSMLGGASVAAVLGTDDLCTLVGRLMIAKSTDASYSEAISRSTLRCATSLALWSLVFRMLRNLKKKKMVIRRSTPIIGMTTRGHWCSSQLGGVVGGVGSGEVGGVVGGAAGGTNIVALWTAVTVTSSSDVERKADAAFASASLVLSVPVTEVASSDEVTPMVNERITEPGRTVMVTAPTATPHSAAIFSMMAV